jgi:glycosyltransferase involved in cell wall biosynthesis
MINLNKNITGITETTTEDMKTPAEVSFKNPFSLPFKNRRISDRRISNRRRTQTSHFKKITFLISNRRISNRRISDRRRTQTSNVKKITVIIPCYNEEKGIGKVIDGVPKDRLKELGYETEIIVIDNNSKDRTTEVAKAHGATVYFEKIQGKVAAMKKGFKEAAGEIIVTIDGDNTYPSSEISTLIHAFDGNDIVIGSRFNSVWNLSRLFEPRSLQFSRVIANKIGAELGSIILGRRITDVTTGLRAFKSDLLNKIPSIKAKNLDFEAELTARVISNGFIYKEVRITSNSREGHSSLNYFKDAFRFLWAMIVGKHNIGGSNQVSINPKLEFDKK